MGTVNLQDRRKLAQERLSSMVRLSDVQRVASLRQFLADVLGFTAIEDRAVAVNDPQLPGYATPIGVLPNEFGPNYTAVHFDLRGKGVSRSYITKACIQVANRVAQQDGGSEHFPLLIFNLPDDSGIQFVTGTPSPDNPDRLSNVLRATAYWESLNRTTLDCLERIGRDIANGEVPQEAFKNGFSVQPIARDFFKSYKEAYDDAVNRLATTIKRADAEQFTQSLLNRLLFIHFVSKKGWLSINGSFDYLNALWRDYQASQQETNFYLDRMKHLFFDGLNNPKSQDLRRDDPTVYLSIGDVPFLNGGLFEQTPLDYQACKGDFPVPDDIIGHVITQLFTGYNFTVMESTSLDTEVAVDPEMLGKLFEETVNERNGSGAYYTPRPVVEFMCREALKCYIGVKGIYGLTDSRIADLVDNGNDQAITPQQALEIGKAVAEMKAVDPACGSGAFLLGMLQEILVLNDSLFRARHTSQSLYRQKLDIISKTIHGTDKDGLAVSTAMLRLWLSLAVDYEGDGAPEPLPNLDLKLVVGDSLAGPDPSPAQLIHQLDLTDQGIRTSTLQADIAAYTTEQDHTNKRNLKKRVEETKSRIRETMEDAAPAGDIEWRIDFADVIAAGGFDVVVGNPPYVQLQRNSGELANLYRNVGYATFARTGDIYQLFYERGCQLLRPNQGILAYITSNSWLKAEYGKTTRRYLTERHTPTLLLEMGKDVFEQAIVDTSVIVVRDGLQDSKRDLTIPATDIKGLEEDSFPPPLDHWGSARPKGDAPWSILSATEQRIMDKMLAIGTPLKDWDITINYGIKTGYNEAFIIDNRTKDELVANDPRSAEILKPVVRGRDIRRYKAVWQGLWLIATFPAAGVKIDDYPAVKKHLLTFGIARLEQSGKRLPDGTRSRKKTNNAWYEMQDTCAYHADFAKEKLFWMDLTDSGRFAYEDGEKFCLNTVFMMTGQALKYHCAVLNSRLITWFMRHTALNSGMGITRWIGHTVEQIPVPYATDDQQGKLLQHVERILAQKAADPAADAANDEDDINQLVYRVYGLTADEIVAVEEMFQDR